MLLNLTIHPKSYLFFLFSLENKGATKINKNETNKEKKRDPKKNHKKHIQIQKNMYSHTHKSLINIKLKIIQIIKQKIHKLKGERVQKKHYETKRLQNTTEFILC